MAVKYRKYTRTCLWCGETFRTTTRAKETCSDSCKEKFEKMAVEDYKRRLSGKFRDPIEAPLTLAQFCLASRQMGISYGVLRARYDLGEVTGKEIKKASDMRVQEIEKEKKSHHAPHYLGFETEFNPNVMHFKHRG